MRWLWHRPGATALIRPLAWETPYAAGAALKKKKKRKKEKKRNAIFIDWVLEAISFHDVFDKMFKNPADFESSSHLFVGNYNGSFLQ